MKFSYLLPSGDYNIVLSRDDIKSLVETGCLKVMPMDTECHTHRLVWDSKKRDMEVRDRKEIRNDLRFKLKDPVDDIGPGVHVVQFLNIRLED